MVMNFMQLCDCIYHDLYSQDQDNTSSSNLKACYLISLLQAQEMKRNTTWLRLQVQKHGS